MVHALLLLGRRAAAAVHPDHGRGLPASLVRGERIAPGQPPVENQWLGGPRTGTAELKGPESEDAEAGGASGRW